MLVSKLIMKEGGIFSEDYFSDCSEQPKTSLSDRFKPSPGETLTDLLADQTNQRIYDAVDYYATTIKPAIAAIDEKGFSIGKTLHDLKKKFTKGLTEQYYH